MQTLSIIGGTGMLGMPVATALHNAGFNVRIISRDITQAKTKLGDNFEYREADLRNVAQLKTALAGSHGIHINVGGHSKQTYYQNHVLGTINILKAIDTASIEFIGMISNASAYPEYADRWDTKYKLAAEALLQDSGIPYVIFMPTWFMEALALFVQGQNLMQVGPSTQTIHWLSASDYADVVVASYTNPQCRNIRMPIYGPEALTMTAAVTKFAAHKQLTIKHLPAWFAKLLGWLLRDPSLVDIADLTVHFDRTGERHSPNVKYTPQRLDEWLRFDG